MFHEALLKRYDATSNRHPMRPGQGDSSHGTLPPRAPLAEGGLICRCNHTPIDHLSFGSTGATLLGPLQGAGLAQAGMETWDLTSPCSFVSACRHCWRVR
jgi:hypothetical protein